MNPVDVLSTLIAEGHPGVLYTADANRILARYGIRKNPPNNPRESTNLADVANELARCLTTTGA